MKVGVEGGGERAFADIGEPGGAGHVCAGFGNVPDAGCGVCAWTFQRGDVEEDGALIADQGLQDFERDGGAAGDGGWDGRAVLVHAVAGRGIEVGLGEGWEGGDEQGK